MYSISGSIAGVVKRTHIREIAASIAALGFCAPVLIGRDNLVIDGVARVEAAKLLGLPRIPCVRVDHLTSAEQRILRSETSSTLVASSRARSKAAAVSGAP